MSKTMQRDLDRAVKSIDEWASHPGGRLDFHGARAEQKMLELCMNFVAKHHKKVTKLIAARETK